MTTITTPARPDTTSMPGPAIRDEFDRIVAELTRRGFLATGLGSAALLGLAACGSSGSPDADSSPATARRTVQTDEGPVSAPVDPRAVVALTGYAVKTLLDLGITPAATGFALSTASTLARYVQQLSGDPVVATSSGAPDLEKIATLHPDLIIDFTADKALGQLQDLAPMVQQNSGAHSWQELCAQVADAVNRTTQLAGVKATYQKAVTVERDTDHAALTGHTWGLIQGATSSVFAVGNGRWNAGAVLAELGCPLTTAADNATTVAGTNYSYEQLDKLADCDVILLANYEALGPTYQQLMATGLWNTLPAVKAGHVYTGSFATSSYGEASEFLNQIHTICTKLEENHP